MKSVVGDVLAVDNESRMERGPGPMVGVVLFARRGGAGVGMRPVWGVLGPIAAKICLLTKQPVARVASRGRDAVSGWTSKVGGM